MIYIAYLIVFLVGVSVSIILLGLSIYLYVLLTETRTDKKYMERVNGKTNLPIYGINTHNSNPTSNYNNKLTITRCGPNDSWEDVIKSVNEDLKYFNL